MCARISASQKARRLARDGIFAWWATAGFDLRDINCSRHGFNRSFISSSDKITGSCQTIVHRTSRPSPVQSALLFIYYLFNKTKA